MRSRLETWRTIGDLTFHLVSDDERLTLPADDLARRFLVAPCRPDVEIRSRWTDAPIVPAGEPVFDSGPAWQLHRAAGAFLFTFRSADDPLPYKSARFDPAFTSGDVDVYRPRFAGRPADAVDPLDYPLDELLAIHVLSQGRGTLVHACGVLDARGRAYVFAGQSGAGKSTLARMCAEASGLTMLSDERVVLRTDRDVVTVHGTPWHGDAMMVSPRSGPLAGVFFLRHAPAHEIVPMPASLASARLMACAFLPFHSQAAVEHTLTAVERAASAVACGELRFAPESSVVDVLTRDAGLVRG